ncbi:Hypothetical predicted protein [Pelobates cultripes]|uniref:Uncharacterized protein n=1 Tax=Pelobates cultripes TaxID=61616 RepID=A0AAD1RSH4_PELCU|nr:Hypothetical predicted protein [Pelobates cultripes]
MSRSGALSSKNISGGMSEGSTFNKACRQEQRKRVACKAWVKGKFIVEILTAS